MYKKIIWHVHFARVGMIITVVCCFSVVCTAVLSTYGISTTRPPSPCLAFSLAFASTAILVSAVYYLVIKVSVMAMGVVIDADPVASSRKRRGFVDRSKFERVPPSDEEISEAYEPYRHGAFCSEIEDQDDCKHGDAHDIESISPWSFSSDDDGDENSAHKTDHDKNTKGEIAAEVVQAAQAEKYSTLKIWTNVYGLAVGIFCIVHSLLLASDLGSCIFCLCLWVESLRECTCYCRQKKYKSLRKKKHECLLVCLSALLLVGIVLRTVGSILSAASFSETDALSLACNILLPVGGVVSLRTMRKTGDIRSTMEVSAPVCWLGSAICLLCVLVVSSGSMGSTCVYEHAFESENASYYSYSFDDPVVTNVTENAWLSVSGRRILPLIRAHNEKETGNAVMRFQPILSVLVIPVPLVCSVVAVISCSQNSHIMVSLPFL